MFGIKSICMLVLSVILIIQCVDAARILAVFPTSSPSHYISGSGLIRALAAKGHDVTVITPFDEKKHPNIRLIKVPEVLNNKFILEFVNSDKLMGKSMPLDFLVNFHKSGVEGCHLIFESPKVQKLLTSADEHFDLLIIEIFLSESLLGLADHFKAPIVAFSTFGTASWHTELVGATQAPAFVPHLFAPFSPSMSFKQRLINVLIHGAYLVYYHSTYLPQQELNRQKHFPNGERTLAELRNNVSLVISNQHFSLSSARQYPPNIIEAAGMHIDDNTQPLPDDLKSLLDNASEGAVYFSLGSNFKSKHISPDKFEAILKTLGSLKEKVLWKFENDTLPGIPPNVHIRPWYPQPGVLRHPNVKLFITHGGLLSTTETIHYGKPIVGIPLFGDQPLNMQLAEQRGIGRKVDYRTLNEQNFKSAVNDVLHNPKYTEKVQHISRIYHDQPMKPVETAVFWTEYVIRHNGASHFHTPAMDLNFWQYHSLDTISTIAFIVVLIVGGFIWFILAILRFLLKGKKKVKTH